MTKKSANDPGPMKNHEVFGINISDAARHFRIDENSMRVFIITHEEEIRESIKNAAFDAIESLGFLEGLLPMSSPKGL
jgi:hypothetical protein